MTDLIISLPNDISEEAQQAAQAMDMTLDELFSEAINLYLATLHKNNIREQLDRVYETESSNIDSSFLKMQLASVGREKW